MPFYDILSTFDNRALHNHTTKICTLCQCVYFQLHTPTASHNNPHIYSDFTPQPIMCNRFLETAQHPHHHAKNTNVAPCPLRPIRHTESHTTPLQNIITSQKSLPPQHKPKSAIRSQISRCSKLVYSQNGFILMQILFFFEGAMRAL